MPVEPGKQDAPRPARFGVLAALWARLPGAPTTAPALCLTVFLIIGIWPNAFFETSRNWLFDSYERLSPARHDTPRTLLIDIDPESIRRVGQWPWPRDTLARLVDVASEARVIGLDLLLSEPDRLSPENWVGDRSGVAQDLRARLLALPSTDEALARSLARVPVVMAALAIPLGNALPESSASTRPILENGADPRIALTHYAGVLRPLTPFVKAAQGLGIVSVPTEADGVMRRVPAVVYAGGALLPGFGIEIARVALGAEHVELQSDSAGIRDLAIGGMTVPTDQRGRVWLHYARGMAGRSVPAYRLLSGEVPPSVFAGKIVLIGSSAPGLGDVVVSPLRETQPGVTLHMQLIEGLMDDDLLSRRPLNLAAELLAAILLSAAATILLRRFAMIWYVLVLCGLTLGVVLGSYLAFRIDGLLLDWTFPLAAMAATGLVALAASMRDEVRMRREREVQLSEALFQAEAADRTKTEFLANVSHELRTPLSAVIGFSEVMQNEMMGPMPPVYADYSRDIHNSGKHLLSIINDVLDLSVLDLGGGRPGEDLVDLRAALGECERMAAIRGVARRVRIRQDLGPDLPLLRVDARMLRQMVLNLLSNAIKYSPDDSDVSMRAYLADQGLCISVRDAGPGIPESEIPNMLQRFGRLRSAKLAQEPGIGIGLPLTKSMVELHRGKLDIRSDVGKGTEAVLWFPAALLSKGVATMKLGAALALLAVIAFGHPAAAEEVVGSVKTLSGTASIVREGQHLGLQLGSIIYEKDLVETGEDGRVGITFRDNTRVAIGPDSRLELTHFIYRPREKKYGFILRLVHGTLEYISGLTAKLAPETISIEMPTSTIAVRGTHLLARAED